MKQAAKEYMELCKLSTEWMVNHWKGILFIWSSFVVAVYVIFHWYDQIKRFAKKLFKKSGEES